MKHSRFFLALTVTLMGCTRDDSPIKRAIVDATTIDAKGITPHAVLVVADGRIFATGTKTRLTMPARTEQVDGRNKFVVPAFVREPVDWPETPMTTLEEIETRVNVEGMRVVFGIAEDRVVEENRWFDLMRQKSVVFVPRISRLEPSSESYRIASQNLLKMANSDVAIAALAPRNNPADIFLEFEAMARVGLSPEQILNAATLNAALAVNDDDYGLLLNEKRASLLMLNANPMDDIANLRKIDRVMVNGNWTNTLTPFVN